MVLVVRGSCASFRAWLNGGDASVDSDFAVWVAAAVVECLVAGEE